MMLIGIDVGGTFTDGVVFDNGRVSVFAKEATDDENLSQTLLNVLDKLLIDQDVNKIDRVVLSTTLVTNLTVTDSGPRTALILMSGYGLPQDTYNLAPDTYFLKGCMDFRGNEITPPDKEEICQVIKQLKDNDIKRIAIAGKFSNRNQRHELFVKAELAEQFPEAEAVISSRIAQQLNFPRRAFTAYLTARTSEKWNNFIDHMQQALKERQIKAPIHILKADGGTMPLETARENPCETIFSGPAASTMGGLALTWKDVKNSVVLDIGGTTTDISLIIAGQPLYASQGARINGKLTHIKSFAVKSVPLGGDSVLRLDNDILHIGPERKGPAACFGGEYAAVTDAFNYLYKLNIGEPVLSEEKLALLALPMNLPLTEFCQLVTKETLTRLKTNIDAMFKEWEQEPAYRVWEIVNRQEFHLDRIIGIGAAAEAIIPKLASDMQIDHMLHEYSPVANALGSAVARPTLAVNMHADTQADLYSIEPGGIQGRLNKNKDLQLEDVKEITRQYLLDLAVARGLGSYAREAQFTMEEQFNVIRGWDRLGKLYEVGMQIKPGFIDEFEGVD